MGCPGKVTLGTNFKFSICTHDPDTGVLTDADSAPAYRIYEDETATAILSGTMAKLDDANTTGFYTELVACSTANGFEDGKTYSVYIAATVDSDTGGISYEFNVDGNRSEPGQGAPAASITWLEKLDYIYKAWRNKSITDATTIKVYDDAGTTVDQKATISDDGTDFTKGEYGSGA